MFDYGKQSCGKLLKGNIVNVVFLGFPFAITNHLGDALFRGVAVSNLSGSIRTNSTSWVHFSSLPHKIYEKFQSPRREAFLRHPSVHDWG